MCLSFDEKTRAKEVVAELDNIGNKIMDQSRSQLKGESDPNSFKQEQLLKLHSSLLKELNVFIEKC